MRIVSLVPSLTHTICDFGLSDYIVGCTSYCVSPKKLAELATIVGGTKDPQMKIIRKLKPTHIIANKEENRREDIEACNEICDTLTTFPKSPVDVPEMLRELGLFLNQQSIAGSMADMCDKHMERLQETVAAGAHSGSWLFRRYLYLIWKDPYMLAGRDTYISNLLGLLGFQNAWEGAERYPKVELEDICSARPNLVYLSSEPFPFNLDNARELKSEWPEMPEIFSINGQIASWYGTTTIDAVRQLRNWVIGESQLAVKELQPYL